MPQAQSPMRLYIWRRELDEASGCGVVFQRPMGIRVALPLRGMGGDSRSPGGIIDLSSEHSLWGAGSPDTRRWAARVPMVSSSIRTRDVRHSSMGSLPGRAEERASRVTRAALD